MANLSLPKFGCFVVFILVVPAFPFLFEDVRTHTAPLNIAAFNIRHFGRGLMAKSEVVSHLVKIFDRYDLVLVQEVRDSTNTALKNLKTSLLATGKAWDYVASIPIGSTHYKEQYVFFYKAGSVSVVSSHQVNDSVDNFYEREPFVVEIEYTSEGQNGDKRVVLMPLHTKPREAKEELQRLPVTIKSVASLYPNTNGVIALGDMNADCNYLAGKWRSSLEIFNSSDFINLIPDSADTAVSHLNCAYDRIIVYGNKIDTRNAGVFNFEDAFQLNKTEALEVSDHYPVEFMLY